MASSLVCIADLNPWPINLVHRVPSHPYPRSVLCQLHPRALDHAGIPSSTCRACSGRAQSACFARARTTPHCRTRRDPTLAPSASLSHALAAPLLHDPSGVLLHRWPRPWRHAGVGSGLCHVRHRPNHASAPAAPGNSSCLSSCSSECFRRRHDALPLQESGRRRSYLLPPQSQPRHAI